MRMGEGDGGDIEGNPKSCLRHQSRTSQRTEVVKSVELGKCIHWDYFFVSHLRTVWSVFFLRYDDQVVNGR